MTTRYKLTYHFRHGGSFTVPRLDEKDFLNFKAMAKDSFKENLNFYITFTSKSNLGKGWVIRGEDITHITYRKLLWGWL